MSRWTPRRTLAPTTWIDIGVVLALSVLAALGFASAFAGAGWMLAAAGGLLVGGAAAIVCALYRLGPLSTAAVAVGSYILFGSAFAMPGSAVLGIIPTPATMTGLVLGPVYGWRDLVTLTAPVDAPAAVTVVPYVACVVVALVGVTIVARGPAGGFSVPRALGALAAPFALLVVSNLVGTDEGVAPLVRGGLFALIALAWVAARAQPAIGNAGESVPAYRRRRLLGAIAMLAITGLAGGLSAAALSPLVDDRFVVRDQVEPPFAIEQFGSPLAGFRSYSKLRTDDTIFTVSGLEPGARVRLASLDSYDAVTWSVAGANQAEVASGTYELVGSDIAGVSLDGERVRVQFVVGEYADVWLPSPGYATHVEFGGQRATELADGFRYNAASGTGVVLAGLRTGDVVTVDAIVPQDPGDLSAASTSTVAMPPAASIQVVGAAAEDLAGGAVGPWEQLTTIADALRTDGYLRRGLATEAPPTSRAGHGADRLIQLLGAPAMVGDEEQFAAAFALMARSLGYPSRVVMGFTVPDSPGESIDVHGSDVTAWVEVAFDGVGWVAFDPTPEKTSIPDTAEPQPQTKPQPQVRQPPPAARAPDDLAAALEVEGTERDDEGSASVPGWVWTVAWSVGVPLVVLAVPFVLAMLARAARRSARRSGPPWRRMAGGWDELIDGVAELGYAVPPVRTRVQAAGELASATGRASEGLLALAHDADRAVFSDAATDGPEAQDYWRRALGELDDIAAGTPRWRRIVSRFYVRPRPRGAARRASTPASTGRDQRSGARAAPGEEAR